MTHHQNQLGSKLATAELQTAHHAAFGVSASVASIPQHKQITWHGIEHRVNWHTGICTAQDGSVRGPAHGSPKLHASSKWHAWPKERPQQSARCQPSGSSKLPQQEQHCLQLCARHAHLGLQGHSQKCGHPSRVMDGGSPRLVLKRADCCGEHPMNSTFPDSRW